MKRPAGLILFTSLLLLLGMKLLLGHSASGGLTGVRALRLVLGVISLSATYALWTRRSNAMRTYWIWVLAWLVGGGVAQYFYQDVPALHIGIWWVSAGSVLCFVGLYLKGALKRTT